MGGFLGGRIRRVALVSGAALAVSAGLAYASIPEADGTFHACVSNDTGAVRIIDTSASGSLGHCLGNENQVSWNKKGQDGAKGAQGLQGEKGATGATGPQGPRGAAGPAGGSQGDVGPAGPKGDTGATGAPGPKGDTGAAGANGAPGPKGDTGAAGANGAPGPKGDTGAAGANGAPGPKGDTGAAGADGAPGPKGDTGAAGPTGATGAQGSQGPPAAVSVATANGLTVLPTGVVQFLARPATVTIAAGQIALVQSQILLGTSSVYQATNLRLGICYQNTQSGSIHLVLSTVMTPDAPPLSTNEYSLTYPISGLPAGTYLVGMCGTFTGFADQNPWDSRSWSFTTAEVLGSSTQMNGAAGAVSSAS